MANCIIVLGKTGTGKSTSIKGLNPKETVVINTLRKRLPFRGSSAIYSKEQKNLFCLENYQDIVRYLQKIDENATYVKNVVLDDSIFVMRKEFFARAKDSGYGKFTELAAHYQQIISTCETLREDLNVFFILHSEEVTSDGSIVGYKVATVGKMLDSQYNPIEVVPMVLYSAIRYDNKGVAEYGFYTHACKEGNVEIPAKTPDGMFEDDFITNDLGLVVKAMNDYYNGPADNQQPTNN